MYTVVRHIYTLIDPHIHLLTHIYTYWATYTLIDPHIHLLGHIKGIFGSIQMSTSYTDEICSNIVNIFNHASMMLKHLSQLAAMR